MEKFIKIVKVLITVILFVIARDSLELGFNTDNSIEEWFYSVVGLLLLVPYYKMMFGIWNSYRR